MLTWWMKHVETQEKECPVLTAVGQMDKLDMVAKNLMLVVFHHLFALAVCYISLYSFEPYKFYPK